MTLYDRVRAVTATVGTGPLTMGGAVSGYRSFDVIADGDLVPFVIEDGFAWEIGNGVYDADTNTMTRTLVRSSTGSLLSLTGGAQVFISPHAEDIAFSSALAGISSLTPSNDDFLQWKAGTWANRTPAQAKADMGAASTASGLAQFAATSSAQLRGVISDETGTGALVFAGSPVLGGQVLINTPTPMTPTNLGTPNLVLAGSSATVYAPAGFQVAEGGALSFDVGSSGVFCHLIRNEAASGRIIIGDTSASFQNDIWITSTGSPTTPTINAATNGNVGVGTTSPGTKLDVAGAVRVRSGNSLFLQNAAGNSNCTLSNTGGAGVATLTINGSGGNVGVGAAPVVKLDVDGPVAVKSYTAGTVPAAAAKAGQIIYVSNEAGGAVLAFSDATDWRRVTDRTVVS